MSARIGPPVSTLTTLPYLSLPVKESKDEEKEKEKGEKHDGKKGGKKAEEGMGWDGMGWDGKSDGLKANEEYSREGKFERKADRKRKQGGGKVKEKERKSRIGR